MSIRSSGTTSSYWRGLRKITSRRLKHMSKRRFEACGASSHADPIGART